MAEKKTSVEATVKNIRQKTEEVFTGRENPHRAAKTFYHSCGALMPLIDDLIEIGVQILNPIQPLPGLMDPEALIKRYRGQLVFHGGLDVQTLLVKGTPMKVFAHVRNCFDVLEVDHYIMTPANSVQPGAPPQNLVAAFDTARKSGLG